MMMQLRDGIVATARHFSDSAMCSKAAGIRNACEVGVFCAAASRTQLAALTITISM